MMVSHFVTGDGCAIAYRFDGPDDAPVIVLSNSLGTDMSMWSAQVNGLAAAYRVLRYDNRGHGASNVSDGAYGLDRLGRDLVELLEALDLPKVTFCGLSLGGMVGQWLAVRAPERLNRLILANTSAFMPPASSWDQRIAMVKAKGMEAIADAVVERWFTPEFRAMATPELTAIKQTFLGTSANGYAGCCAAVRDMDLRPLVTLIRTPTLIIGGERDPATPLTHSRLLADSIDGAILVTLDAAHLSNVEMPEAFLDAVLKFTAA